MRVRHNALFPIATSPARLSECLGLRRKVVDDAIKAGELPIYKHGAHRRVLIEDAVAWIRNTWKKEN